MQPNWQQQGYGYQQPFQQQQFTGQPTGNAGFLSSQPTGFPAQQEPLATGRPSGNLSFLNAPPPSGSFGGGGMMPQMTGYPGGGASGLMPQATGFPGGGLMSQPTGMGMRAQPTGYQDPRLQSMMQSFMPSNLSQPFAPSGVPQFNQSPSQPLAQTFQTLLQNPSVKTPKVPWTLSKQEKKDYDRIFRAWEGGDGFISGETAREVFGQSGLGQDDLLKIWTLSDVDNRGKLNLPEFHVAMGLIYRALNGNDIPDALPEELVPASMRDIDTTVNFMRDLLKHESTSRSNTSSPGYSAPAAKSRDASAYKYDESSAGKTYKPSSRHLDRKAVRYAGEDSNADISDIRRQLQNTSAMLDKSSAEAAAKSEEDERLEQEVDDLKYRVRRLQEDIDYVSKGRRTAEKDEERRKLERELLFLMHEKLPELERRQQQREDEKRMDERAGNRNRDRRNETHGRYDDRDRDDHSWLRGSYDRRDDDRRDSYDREYRRDDSRDDRYGRDRDYRDRERDRSRDRYDRPRSPPPAARSPPPAPPPAPVTDAVANPPPAPPKPTKTPDVPNTKNMTPEERTAFIREQAQRRIQERLRALGVETASETPAIDKSVEERLAQEKKEAEERSKTADAEQKAREEARQARLHGTGAPAEAPKSPEPAKGILKKGPPAPPTSRGKAAPPPPASRGTPSKPPPAPAPPTSTAPAPAEDPEEAEFRRREEAILKAKEERRKRLEQLEKEEEEERQREEQARTAKSVKSPAAEVPLQSPPAPVAPPAPTPPASGGGYNPFRKPGAAAGATVGAAAGVAAGAAASKGGFNPFFKPTPPREASPAPASESVVSPAAEAPASAPTSAPPAPAPPPAPPAPPAPAPPAINKAPAPTDDDWESIHEKEADSDDSSDDDDYATSRDNRRNLASALFGGIGGGSGSNSAPSSRPGSAKPQPSAALKNLGGGDPSAGRGALLSAIQGGARLKKAETVVKGEPVSGRVVGDAAPPSHINLSAQEHESTPEPESFNGSSNRHSVDWYAGLAADQHPAASAAETLALEPTREEPEAETVAITVQDSAEEDPLADFDLSKSIRVRTLFPYEGQRDVDLTFKENVVIVAHPAKDPSSPWWYGMLVDGGAKGWFPSDYVEELQHVKARALYSYAGGSDEELPFAEGDELVIVDQSDPDWWKTEKSGVIFIVPATYFEVIG